MSLKSLTSIGDLVRYRDDSYISVSDEDVLLYHFWRSTQHVILRLVYNQSRVDLNNHYENCAMLTYKTHNSQRDLDGLDYYVFSNLISYIHKIMKEESDAQSSSDVTESSSDQFSKMQSSAKSMMSGFKVPKIM